MRDRRGTGASDDDDDSASFVSSDASMPELVQRAGSETSSNEMDSDNSSERSRGRDNGGDSDNDSDSPPALQDYGNDNSSSASSRNSATYQHSSSTDSSASKSSKCYNAMDHSDDSIDDAPVQVRLTGWLRVNAHISQRSTPASVERVLCQLDMNPLSCRSDKGETLVHAAAAEDNIPLLEWLVEEKGLDPLERDSDGVLAYDKATKKGVKNKIKFLSNKYQRKLKWSAIKVQAARRSYVVRKGSPKIETCAYREWLPLIHAIQDMEVKGNVGSSWMDILRDMDLVVHDELDMVGDAALQLEELEDEDEEDYDGDPEVGEPSAGLSKPTSPPKKEPPVSSIMMTAGVLAWTRKVKDQKYRDMFKRRLEQLAKGERSYALCKRLKGSEKPLFETKLDRGQRIIWMNWRGGILIWFVCKHDDISKCVQKVNLSYNRVTERDGETAGMNYLSEMLHGYSPFPDLTDEADEYQAEPEMLVSPFSNVPLKIHSLQTEDLDKFVSNVEWTPPIKLTAQEETIVRRQGTVLVLGRSGTGKTLCVYSRINFDRQNLGKETRQLFLARTKRLCNFVKSLVTKSTDIDENVKFMTVTDWVERMQNTYRDENATRWRLQSHATYRTFCDKWEEIKGKEKNLDRLQVWTQIRSFIKGSFEAAQKREPLTIEEYAVQISKDRCRLDEAARRKAYACFERYQSILDENGWWDDMDRVMHVVQLLQNVMTIHRDPLYDRIYVDEVQDITQAEIGLLFLVSGNRPDSLFLAGDPAQAVSQGVDFRFEEVRSVVHMISKGEQKIERWQKLKENFRSHEGILTVANVVLGFMHYAFPEAALKLPPDTGLVQGPRPGLMTATYKELEELLRNNERIRVLVRDDAKEEILQHFPKLAYAVYGIIEAKGLEFSDVLIVDFFSKCKDEDLRKGWKKLLGHIVRSKSSASRLELPKLPQTLELELKLLYTAITRSQNRLHFVETQQSDEYSKWNRLLLGDKGNALAEKLKFGNVMEEGKNLMTSDEWRVQGTELAIEAQEDNETSSSDLLERAIAHFEKAGDSALVDRARKHLKAVELTQAARQAFLEDPTSSKAAQDGTDAILTYLELGLLQEASVLGNEFCRSAGLTGLGKRIAELNTPKEKKSTDSEVQEG